MVHPLSKELQGINHNLAKIADLLQKSLDSKETDQFMLLKFTLKIKKSYDSNPNAFSAFAWSDIAKARYGLIIPPEKVKMLISELREIERNG
jgi:hypothetical protein